MATKHATSPPSEWPTRSTRPSGKREESHAATSSAISWIVYVPGQALAPWPRRLTAKTVLVALIGAVTTSQSSAVSPMAGRSTNGGCGFWSGPHPHPERQAAHVENLVCRHPARIPRPNLCSWR